MRERCKRCGSPRDRFPRRDWITMEGKLFCDRQCRTDYYGMNLFRRAEQACFGLPEPPYKHEDYHIACTPETWESLIALKDQMIDDRILTPINAGPWRKFYGFRWSPDDRLPHGEFEVRLNAKRPAR